MGRVEAALGMRRQRGAALAEELEAVARRLTAALAGKIEAATLQQTAAALGIVIDKMQSLWAESDGKAERDAGDGLTDAERLERLAFLLERGGAGGAGRDPAGSGRHRLPSVAPSGLADLALGLAPPARAPGAPGPGNAGGDPAADGLPRTEARKD
jgi:hypothetical protein